MLSRGHALEAMTVLNLPAFEVYRWLAFQQATLPQTLEN